jgi:NAD+ synthase
MESVRKKIVEGIKEFFSQRNFSKAVIGLSGGLDSSVCAALVAEALGKENVFGIIMPEIGLSSKESSLDAENLCRKLGIDYKIVPINSFVASFTNLKWNQNRLAIMNTKPRVRANILYNYANSSNALVIGTSNKSELMLGYFTKYGDGACDVEVIGDLFKTEVVELAKELGLSESIITKKPSAELFEGQTDEEELGASYEEIDALLEKIEKGEKLTGKLAEKIIKRVEANKHKLDTPPVIK